MAVVEQQRKQSSRLKLQRMFHANRIIFRTSERISSPSPPIHPRKYVRLGLK